MADQPEKLYTAREVAGELGLGAAMLRRYAATYETLSGDEITMHRRDGRLFTEAQVRVLGQARALVMQTSVDVETAVKQALDKPLQPAPVALAQSSAPGSAELIEALTAAQMAANAPLLNELRGIRDALERLEASGEKRSFGRLEATWNNPDFNEAETSPSIPESKHGPVVRFALWLESRLRGRS